MKLSLPCLFLLISSFIYGQDLVVHKFEVLSSYDQHEIIDPVIEIKNNSAVAINAASWIGVDIYISTDSIKNSNDILITNTSTHSTFAAGQVRSVTCWSCNLQVPAGNYFLILQIDPESAVNETDEQNNTYVFPGFVVNSPDIDWQFDLLEFTNPATAVYDQIDISYHFENTGSTNPFGQFFVNFFLSTDNVLSSDDINLNYWRPHHLAVNEGIIYSYISIPQNTAQGQYYVIGTADRDNDYVETDETNNTAVTSTWFTIGVPNVDLQIVEILSAESFTLAGGMNSNILNASIKASNSGTTAIHTYDIKVSLSCDAEIGDDINLSSGNQYTGAAIYLGPGSTASGSVYISAGYIAPGEYYLVMEINPGRNIPETNTANNIIISDRPWIRVGLPPKYIFNFTGATLARQYDDTDKNLDVTISYNNTGTDVDVSHYPLEIEVRDLYLSTLRMRSELFTPLLDPGMSDSKTTTLKLGYPLPPGEYELIFRMSSYPSIWEYRIPLIIDKSPVFLSGTIQGEDGIPIDKGKLFLYQKMSNGKVKFIEKTVPTTSTQFSYAVSNQPHTLFFIPDPVSYPDYAPTIYGKTVTVKPSSYIKKTAVNKTVLFEVIKIYPMATGNRSVTGNVNTGNTSRAATASEARESLEDYPVILLSESGEAVALAMTDANGNYAFHNLPAAKYKVVVAFELDQAIMEQPLPVDVTTHDAKADIAVTPQGTLNTIAKSTERISLDAPSIKIFGDQPVNINATSASGLPVTLTSTDLAVAEVINGKVVIKGAGTVTITATTSGNSQFWPATTTQTLIVNKSNQHITFEAIPVMTTHDKSYHLQATASSMMILTATSDNEQVATVDGLELIVTGPGVANITVAQNGNNNFNAALPVTRQLVVNVVMRIEETAGSLRPYPNPTTGLVHLPFKDVVQKIEVADAMGKVHDNISWTNEQIDLSSLNTGVYFIRVQHASAATVFRIVKE